MPGLLTPELIAQADRLLSRLAAPDDAVEVIDTIEGVLLRPAPSHRLSAAQVLARRPTHVGDPLSLDDMDGAVLTEAGTRTGR